MVTEEIIEEIDRIQKILTYFKENKSLLTIKTENGIAVTALIENLSPTSIQLKDLRVITENSSIDECIGVGAEVETSYGANTIRFDTLFLDKSNIKYPLRLIMHPKRKYPRVRIKGNPLVTNMYAIYFMKVIDPTIKDSTLQQKIDAILKTIESNIRRSENYDFAKVFLFDETHEKNALYKLVRMLKKPFAVMDTSNIKLKEDFIITYEDYIKMLAQSGKSYTEISQTIEEIRHFYEINKIVSEAIVPIFFDEEVIGVIRVMSKKQKLSAGAIKRLISLSQNASLKLETEGSFETITKDPQEIIDLSVGGMRTIIRDSNFCKYIRINKRMFCQIFFPDKTYVKVLAAVVNIYARVSDEIVDVGLKFSANIDWKDKVKIENFVNSILDLERKGAHRIKKST
jgi:hypothetical protein